MRDVVCLRENCPCLSEGAGAVGAAGGGRKSLGLLDLVIDGGVTIGFGETNSECGAGLDRGFGDWILAIAWACTEVVGPSSSEDSDSDDEDEDEDDGSSSSSRNSNTLGTFLAGSTGLSCGAAGAASGFEACFDELACSFGDDFLSLTFGFSTGPAWAMDVVLETVDAVLFLPSFLGFLERRLCMMIGEGRKRYPAHHFDRTRQLENTVDFFSQAMPTVSEFDAHECVVKIAMTAESKASNVWGPEA